MVRSPSRRRPADGLFVQIEVHVARHVNDFGKFLVHPIAFRLQFHHPAGQLDHFLKRMAAVAHMLVR